MVVSLVLKVGYAIVQLVEALRYKPEGRGFDSLWGSLVFFTDLILPTALWSWGSPKFREDLRSKGGLVHKG